jgi:hypothetical protein
MRFEVWVRAFLLPRPPSRETPRELYRTRDSREPPVASESRPEARERDENEPRKERGEEGGGGRGCEVK